MNVKYLSIVLELMVLNMRERGERELSGGEETH
jgi:hypothetical protein